MAGPAVPITKEAPPPSTPIFFPYFIWRRPLRDLKIYEGNRANLDMMMILGFASKSTVTRPTRVGMRKLTLDDAELIRQTAKREFQA